MASLQVWHITVFLVVLLIAAAVAGLVHYIRRNSERLHQDARRPSRD